MLVKLGDIGMGSELSSARFALGETLAKRFGLSGASSVKQD